MTQTFRKYFIALILFFSFSEVNAQVLCNGALGDAIAGAGTDFGRGLPQFGASVSETGYFYIAGNPNDGQYTIVKTTAGLNSGWHQNIVNHTPNDPDGYFMVVNADLNKGIFYQSEITSQLCPNTTYEFAAFIINILRNSGVKPNIRFTITNNGLAIPGADFSTGDIPEGSAIDWIKRGGTFKTPSNLGVIKLIMTNENPGGNGNDLGIDDITFRACGPVITSTVTNANNFTNNVANICVADTKTLILSAKVSAGVYNSPQFQWQEYNGTTWVNSNKPGSQTADLTVAFVNATTGNYKYQVLVSESGNINSTSCRVISTPITINVNDKPNPIASNSGAACVGSDIQLNVNQGVSFSWTGPNGFTSPFQNPIIPNVSTNSSGTYTVTVFNASGCSNTSQTQVQVLPQVIANTNIATATICENESVELIASGGSTYTWLPTEGLSNPNIATPFATPKQTTTYTVKVSNGTCSTTKEILITVLKNASANAGEDKKVFLGQSVTLKGNATGDNITYAWSPTDYLDDPTKLNPIATPPNDITYTLTVSSNCNVSTDEVFVKVYPKIEIPNTFTPNGDGINDTWNIPAIAAFSNPKLKVVNRNGQLVFESTNPQPWDGKSHGKNLPTGVYYYTLYLNEDFKIYSGWVLLTR
ncbi:T9SS type B sorting domain-containing protein [Pedobacter sp. LMG 31464]|uniref:T9SS type B sorting domain-containing protein n=1 Tax=Pedobacter planticolens TaxID=2679964 RepID=A0A923IT33_9SPHI|nr:gliding motility-associated C-terminal domain-containing protein [Pedobacter planticolens]MBB2144255.1 T9SS type B sorting domain-containing protein [Pedobacter planticolens]